jgi:hypothetical protein
MKEKALTGIGDTKFHLEALSVWKPLVQAGFFPGLNKSPLADPETLDPQCTW